MPKNDFPRLAKLWTVSSNFVTCSIGLKILFPCKEDQNWIREFDLSGVIADCITTLESFLVEGVFCISTTKSFGRSSFCTSLNSVSV